MFNFSSKEVRYLLWGFALGIVSFVILIIGVMVWSDMDHERTATQQANEMRCPDDYGDNDAGSAEYLAAMEKWTNAFYDTHPDATLEDWAAARRQFWVDHGCQAALERYVHFNEIER